jgi:hypothetical protein
MRRVKKCGLCGGELRLVLSLGSSPPTCVMVPVGDRQVERHYPLDLLYCEACTLAQLSVVVNPMVMFPAEYPYSSGNSRALHDDFADLAAQATGWAHGLTFDDLVVDVGANDGTLLSKFGDCRKVGVEPTRQAQHIKGSVYRAFLDERVAMQIVKTHGKAKVVTACNVLAHVEDIDETMRAIACLLADDGILIAENHDLKSVVEGQWDTVYHEHLRFWSPYSFHALLAKHGLAARTWHEIPTHGGSFRMMAQRGRNGRSPLRPNYDFKTLRQCAIDARRAIREAATGVYGIGATARATTLINYCGLDVEDVECVCEVAGSDKIGHYIPGTRIPVVDEAKLFEEQPPAILFSWHLADRIVPKLRERGYHGDITVPLEATRQLEAA